MLVSVKELKTHLSRYLGLAESGESIVVTSHDNPIAKLIALDKKQPHGTLTQLVGGAIQWNGEKPQGAKKRTNIGTRSAAEVVLQDRE
jgi:prevent-host-death family protein